MPFYCYIEAAVVVCLIHPIVWSLCRCRRQRAVHPLLVLLLFDWTAELHHQISPTTTPTPTISLSTRMIVESNIGGGGRGSRRSGSSSSAEGRIGRRTRQQGRMVVGGGFVVVVVVGIVIIIMMMILLWLAHYIVTKSRFVFLLLLL